jgi:hypothetical protein
MVTNTDRNSKALQLDYCVTNKEIHQYNTRNASKFHKSYKRTDYVEHTLSNRGFDVRNSSETKLIDINSYNTFKTRQHFLLYNVYTLFINGCRLKIILCAYKLAQPASFLGRNFFEILT